MSTTHDEQADAYLHGLMTLGESAAFERQLRQDPELQAAVDLARRRKALLEAALPPAESSEPVVRRTLERIDEFHRHRRRFRRRTYALLFAPVAACALIVGLFNVHYGTLSASPANLEVYGQSTLIPGSGGALRVRLTDKHTQAPMPGVPVEVMLGEPGSANFMTLATFTTDDRGNGQPAFRLPDWADGSYPLRVTAQTPKPEVLTQRIVLKRSAKLLLTSDKPVYQPGQTIHLRSLTLMRPNLKPAADVEAVFSISDPRGNVIFRRVMRTSRFGIAAADCALADELIEGMYRIQCRVGDTDSSLTVDVHKYVLPKVRLTLATEQPWYQPGQEVKGTLQANYYHGEPAADAEWNLEATTNLPGTPLLAKLSGRTDGEGGAAFSFRMPANVGGVIDLTAKVRDRAGQEQAARLTKRVATKPFFITLIPENGTLVMGAPNVIYLYADTPDEAPAQVKGTVTVGGNTYAVATGELGVAAVTVTPSDAQLIVNIDATDAKGNRQTLNVTLSSTQPAVDYLLRTDRAVYTSGETMRLSVLGGGSGPVFLDILKDDQTIVSHIIDVKEGRGELAVDIPAELFGTLQLCAYRFDNEGRVTRKTRALYIRPARELRIGFKPDKAEYRSGNKAKLDFTLSDEKGRPVPGALSLAMVDEAVFDVRAQLPGLERTFYLLEQKLLLPAGTIYPWSPDADYPVPEAQRQLFEQTYFARTLDTTYPTGVAPGIPTWGTRRSQPSPHTLTAETFTAKQQEVNRHRGDGLHVVNIAWVLLGLALFVAVDVVIWMNMRLLHAAILHGAGGLVLSCLFGLVVLGGMGIGASSEKAFRKAEVMSGIPASADAVMSKASPPQDMPKPPGPAGFGPMGPGGTDVPQVRIRERFPETMLWQPQLITDDAGRASLDLELADSITTWRLSASAVSADGRLGALRSGVKVFQPFFVDLNLPVALTRGDEVEVPAVVANFLPKAQTVELTLERADWFELIGADGLKLELKPREVRAASFRIKVKKVGRHELQVTAKSPELGDAVRRKIEVVPDGRRVERIVNGTLNQPANVKLDLPPEAIEGSGKAIVRIYPSSFSQLVEGLDGIFRLPTGCFEQTSSSLYPNVMALSYLRRVDKRIPEVEAKALQYIHAGYQRLLTFEVSGGGFDWYGLPPANVALTAYGLMEFRDMALVHDVDPRLIERTRSWLLGKRNRDGSWDDDSRYGREEAASRRLRATAYVAWAVFNGEPSAEARVTRDFLLKHSPETIQSPYLLALMCNALLSIDPKDEAVKPYLERLIALKQSSEDGQKTWWAIGNESTTFYGAGRCGDVETTALAVLALIRADREAPLVRSSLAWIVGQREVGHWGSTQATVLALKALLLGTGKPDDGGPRQIDIALDGQVVRTVEIAPDQAEVMQQIDLSARLKTGSNDLTLKDRRGNGPGFQIEFRYHVPGSKDPDRPEPLTIDLKYDREAMTTADILGVTATVTNRLPQAAPMVMLDLPVPAGFRVDTDSFEKLLADRVIERYQVTPLQVIVYLRGLEPGKPLTLNYRLRPGEPAKLSVPPARVWEYYNPDRQGRSRIAHLTVSPGS